MNGKRFTEKKTGKSGIYLALAVCLVAVGIAAWSTYDAVHTYLDSAAGELSSLNELQGQDVRSGQEVSGIGGRAPGNDDPEKPDNTTPAQRANAGVTPGKPTATPAPTPVPTPVPTAEPEEAMVPVNGPIYERSTEMIAPLDGGVLKAYSSGAPVYSETMKDWRIHTGTDFAAQAGEEVHACANGLVQETYTDSMMGNVITIEHGDYLFSYCGVGENFLVKPGDVVTKGQTIGTVTAVPSEAADQPHLHLEVRRDAVWMDPGEVIETKE